MYSITGTITSIKSIGTSLNGNPTLLIMIEGESGREYRVTTRKDSSYAYALWNSEYQDLAHEYTLTEAGLVSKVVPA